MRKITLIMITCATLVLMSGCSSDPLTETLSSLSDSTPAVTATSAPTETPAPQDTILSLGKKGTVGNWELNVKKVSVSKKIKNGKYQFFKPGKGKSFVVVSMSAKNKGEKAEQFLPRVGLRNKMIIAKLYYKDKYEYSATELMGYDKDLTTESIDPLEKASGILAFEVPKKASKSKKQLTLNFKVDEESVSYKLK